MIYPLVTDLAADGVPVAVTCRVLGFSKQGYYRWRASPVTDRAIAAYPSITGFLKQPVHGPIDADPFVTLKRALPGG